MFFVYIISSEVCRYKYVGFTKDIDLRLKQHNGKSNRSTKAYVPFKLIFVQICENRKQARDLEKFLKVNFNKESLLSFIETN